MSKVIIPKDLPTVKVFAIKEGTVVDHIKAGNALKIIRILNLADNQKVVTVGLNLSSKTLGLKDIIKVEKRELTADEISRVAILAPQATINIVRNYKIDKKFQAEMPKVIEYVVVCPNPKCLTNNESVPTKFNVAFKADGIRLKCHYCEKIFREHEIVSYKNN
ncbi:MAG: aspartate carbamoyltransferase regulatory subunit [Patescibacteria group bacterium]